jgi:hypothetical protein
VAPRRLRPLPPEALDAEQRAVYDALTLVGYYPLLATQMRVLRVPLPDGAAAVGFGA